MWYKELKLKKIWIVFYLWLFPINLNTLSLRVHDRCAGIIIVT